jgi:hypothetical protein
MAKEQKDKYFADQMEDEEVLLVFRKHPVVMRKGLILAMVALLLGTIPALIKPEWSFFVGGLVGGFVLGFLILLPSWIAWYYSVFIVTNQRLIQITQRGFFHKSVVDVGINQIQMVNYEIAGLQETLLGFGTIMMQTYLGDLVIHDVHHPAKIQKQLLGILREEGVVTASYPKHEKEDEDDEN